MPKSVVAMIYLDYEKHVKLFYATAFVLKL